MKGRPARDCQTHLSPQSAPIQPTCRAPTISTAAPEMNEARSLSSKVVSSATSADQPHGIAAARSDAAPPPPSSFCSSMGGGEDLTGADRVRAPPVGPEVPGQTAGERVHRGLRTVARDVSAGRLQPPLRGDIDDGGRIGVLEE